LEINQLGALTFAIDSKTGLRTSNPGDVKRIYLQEGAHFLRNKLEKPPLPRKDDYIQQEPPPNPENRTKPLRAKSRVLPKWWNPMYNRNAKKIDAKMWKDLVGPVEWKEVLNTIRQAESEKAAGYDGVSSDLIRLLTDDSSDAPNPLLILLTLLINVAFETGQTLPSWRKAIVSMIPKKKDDGSYTSLVSEMRPISVLQEFGKIASKILANRLGQILLVEPNVMNSAQRAFLKDGCTAQCINIVLNVLEDFKEKQKKCANSRLFLLAYDLVKAYDSVQAYSIRASLERFNFPEEFITYVLSNLEWATSCFKTFYGPTEDISVETSVRQGDPLSPLVFICLTDALHEGFQRNPLYPVKKTGYAFSNDPTLVISSIGYADDTLIYCESWEEIWMMHEWMRDFCHAHGFEINAKKSKYIISDCKGTKDPRWLPSIDGANKIVPQMSSEQFRYLGLWISMDLMWTKQIQIMNRQIMDWRWKSSAANVDPAQLKTSVMDYLLPRLEIGLFHANITERMCDGWTSTIAYTICQRSGMHTIGSLNKKGFFLLAGLPDLWLRTQTARTTELLVNLNTQVCASGRSTRARICSLFNLPASKMADAIRTLASQAINKRDANRIVPTLQHLKKLNITLIHKNVGHKKSLKIVSDIKIAIQKEIQDHKLSEMIAYTDGSTTPRHKYANSGLAIALTDSMNRVFWSGGMIIRSDGNNFIPELAAASMVIKAIPIALTTTLRMDSKAAIGAILKGSVSERKRVRAPGRVWLNFCRRDFIEKRKVINIEHVSSHKGVASAEQQGNDLADIIANEYRRQGELKPPCSYFIDTEEMFYLEHKGLSIQGDARSYLKSLEKEIMLQSWTRKAPKQAKWTKQFPVQVLKQAKRVWKWSVERNEGSAWIYYIFAISQWLPTNHRMYYADKSGFDKSKCKLCLLDHVENMDHLLVCPALVQEQEILLRSTHEKLITWQLPLAHKDIESVDSRTCRRWSRTVKDALSVGRNLENGTVNLEYVDHLVHKYWMTNRYKSCLSVHHLLSNIDTILANAKEVCCRPTAPHQLLSVLVRHFHIQMEGTTDVLRKSSLLREWCSPDESDKAFGALGSLMSQNLAGKNCFIILQWITAHNPAIKNQFYHLIKEWVGTKKATRLIILGPTRELKDWFHPKDRQFFEIAQFNEHSSPLQNNYHHHQLDHCALDTTSVALVLNKESMLLDPIDWPALKRDLQEWADHEQLALSILDWTNKLFLERAPPSHYARVQPASQIRTASSVYHFFDAHSPKRSEEKHMIDCGVPADLARLIDRANHHEKFLSTLGILPNQLRSLLQQAGAGAECEKAWIDISHNLFWAGYNIWKKRKKLMQSFWNKIAPEEWKKAKQKVKQRNKNTGKKRKRCNPSQCLDPFHFLPKIHDFTKQLPTRCPCSKYHRSIKHKSRDIRTFLSSFTSIKAPAIKNDLIHQENTKTRIHNRKRFYTQADRIRDQHDRGKRKR
jgi:hypothetical protein